MEKNNVADAAIIVQVNEISSELYRLASSLHEEQLNALPFEDSWTAAQLVVHVTKSNHGIAQGLDMEGRVSIHDPGGRIEELKKIFLDFTHKFKSPAFIVPLPGYYEKAATMAALQHSNEQIKDKEKKINLSEVIQFPVLGEITKLELLYFVLYHTQRHVHQLRNIIKHLHS
jgi:hypothetical protein